MFGNNNFGINNSWANKSVVDRSHPINQAKSGQYTPEVSAYLTHTRLQPTFNSTTTNSSSDCMKGYNPHNLSHEYHVANGGCVSDAQKAEAKALGTMMENRHVANGIGILASTPCALSPGAKTKAACAYLVQTEVSNGIQKLGEQILLSQEERQSFKHSRDLALKSQEDLRNGVLKEILVGNHTLEMQDFICLLGQNGCHPE